MFFYAHYGERPNFAPGIICFGLRNAGQFFAFGGGIATLRGGQGGTEFVDSPKEMWLVDIPLPFRRHLRQGGHKRCA